MAFAVAGRHDRCGPRRRQSPARLGGLLLALSMLPAPCAGGFFDVVRRSSSPLRPLLGGHGSLAATGSGGGGPLIDGRGFLRDVYPVIEYDDDEDDAEVEPTPRPSSDHHPSSSSSAGSSGPSTEAAPNTKDAGDVHSPKGSPAAADGANQHDSPMATAPSAAAAAAVPGSVRGPTRCYMRARQVPGDGSCLFHALSAGLWLATNGTHHPMERKLLRSQSLFLRRTAVDVLENRRDPSLYMGDGEQLKASQLLQLAAEQQGQTPAEYCANVREPRAWGGGPEIVALANALRRPIHVYELVWGLADPPGGVVDHHDKKKPTASSHPGDETATTTTPASSSSFGGDGLHRTAPVFAGGGVASAKAAPPRRPTHRWCLRCIAEFGSPRFDRKKAPLHILSCDSRFPHLHPDQMLDQGNHFLLLFECDEVQTERAALESGLSGKVADDLAAAAKKRRDARVKDLRRAIKARGRKSKRELRRRRRRPRGAAKDDDDVLGGGAPSSSGPKGVKAAAAFGGTAVAADAAFSAAAPESAALSDDLAKDLDLDEAFFARASRTSPPLAVVALHHLMTPARLIGDVPAKVVVPVMLVAWGVVLREPLVRKLGAWEVARRCRGACVIAVGCGKRLGGVVGARLARVPHWIARRRRTASSADGTSSSSEKSSEVSSAAFGLGAASVPGGSAVSGDSSSSDSGGPGDTTTSVDSDDAASSSSKHANHNNNGASD